MRRGGVACGERRVGKARLILRGQDDVREAFAWSAQAAQLVDDVGLEPDVDVALGAALALVGGRVAAMASKAATVMAMRVMSVAALRRFAGKVGPF